MDYTRVCKRCGTTFTAHQSNAEFCCRKCKDLYRHERERLERTKQLNHELNLAQKSLSQEKEKNRKSFTPSQAAQYIGVARTSVYNYMKSGLLPFIELPGKTLIKKEDIDALFKRKNQKGDVRINPDDYITYYQMCDEYHLSYNFVREVCEEACLKPIVRNTVKYFEKEKVKEAFDHHKSLMDDAKEQRKREYARRRAARRSKDFIPTDYPHPQEWYSFCELMNKYHLDRNQVEQYARENGITKMHLNRYCFFDRKGFDDLFSTTPPFRL